MADPRAPVVADGCRVPSMSLQGKGRGEWTLSAASDRKHVGNQAWPGM